VDIQSLHIDSRLWIALAAVLGTLVVALVVLGLRRKKIPETQKPVVEKPPGLSDRLGKTRDFFRSRFEKFGLSTQQKELKDSEWEQVEEALLEADVGISTTTVLLDKVKNRDGELRNLLKEECRGLFEGMVHGPLDFNNRPEKPFVISIVGVNGVGKTTTIGKLANQIRKQGMTVLLGAADTFRAGAISQLKIWAERSDSQFVAGKEGGDPGAVAFDSVSAGKARGLDVVILDTAGRLHTKTNLMDELKKIHRVVKKVIPEAPHETWLVLDGTIGQNSVQQAREFQKSMDLSGIIITKLDGTAKGGAIFSIVSELKLPIRYIGIGESAEDFIPFDPKLFVDAILG
jgi:fused signal recognition particle receptor